MFNEWANLGELGIDYKPGVSGSPSPQIQNAINIAGSIYAALGKTLTVTSIRDSTHMVGSLHYSGNAVDLRTNNLTATERSAVTTRLRAALPYPYQVINEGDHIHIEWEGGAAAVAPKPTIPGASVPAVAGSSAASNILPSLEILDTPFFSGLGGISTLALAGMVLVGAYFLLR